MIGPIDAFEREESSSYFLHSTGKLAKTVSVSEIPRDPQKTIYRYMISLTMENLDRQWTRSKLSEF